MFSTTCQLKWQNFIPFSSSVCFNILPCITCMATIRLTVESGLRPIQWYHFQVNLIWPEGKKDAGDWYFDFKLQTKFVMHCKENPIFVFLFWELCGLSSQFPHSCVCERFIFSHVQSTYFPAAEPADRSWKYINLSQIYEWRKELYNSVLELTVLFLGIHKWEPDIYIGFSSALHLQCAI